MHEHFARIVPSSKCRIGMRIHERPARPADPPGRIRLRHRVRRVDQFRARHPDAFMYVGNREVAFDVGQQIDESSLRDCICPGPRAPSD